ncbi:Uma2 family endonuclease [Streptomyces sp. NPDC101150]|uniref:Uma2 family endonuclease n=1 Tax=Streptomyces sp. NPDC101150 TaxID=3366114 RepID=UPI003814BA4B
MIMESVPEWEDPAELLAALEKAYGIPVRAEYLEGIPVLPPPRSMNHSGCASESVFQLHEAGFRAGTGNGYRIGSPGDWTGALVIPDFYVLRRKLTEADHAHFLAYEGWYPADLLGLVGEVTSTLHEIDSGPKYRAYASAGVPVYVLIHRQKGRAYAFSDPVAGNAPEKARYATTVRVELGRSLSLPAPYTALDTSALLKD